MYDGHGNHKCDTDTGKMLLHNNIEITQNDLENIFTNYNHNKKIFFFSQCGSYSFANELIQNKLIKNYIYITSNTTHKAVGYGAKIFKAFRATIDEKTKDIDYETFQTFFENKKNNYIKSFPDLSFGFYYDNNYKLN